MIQLGFSLVLSLLLTFASWVGFVAPATAQASFSTTSLSTTSFSTATFGVTTFGISMGKSLFSFSGTRPTNLGIKDGKLAACPSTPNCVSSQAPDADSEHKIAPLRYSASASEAMTRLKSVIQSMERTALISEAENYLYVEFTSALMGYVDDVEFFLDSPASVIQVRSASRLGKSDLGVNRKRIEAIRARFED